MRQGLRTVRWTLLIGVCVLVLVSCGEDETNTAAPPPLTSTEVLQRGADGVGVTTMTFVDTSRATMPNGNFPGAPSRTLVTEIWYPTAANATGAEVRDAPLADGGRPFPLIIYSHGFISMRTGGAYLAQQLASDGYIVAAPDFPLTNTHAPGGPNVLDVVQQPGDVHFLIGQLLGLSAEPGGRFSGGIDSRRIGLTGLSLGGTTTFLSAFHPTLRDTRVRAAAPMAGDTCFLGPGFYDGRSLPLLILHGDLDAIVPYQQNAVFAFGEANPPKYLATITGGSHTGFADGTQVFDAQNNVDDIGCFALRGTLSEGGDQSLLDELGGAGAGIIAGDCPAPCSGSGPLPRAIRPSRQQQLTILTIVPFFEATFRGDQRARHFLEQTVAAENPELKIQRK